MWGRIGLEAYADLWVPNMTPKCKMLPIMLNKGKIEHSILLKLNSWNINLITMQLFQISSTYLRSNISLFVHV